MASKSSTTACQTAWDPDQQPIPFANPWGRPGAYTTMLVDGDPLADLSALTRPVGVWARGREILRPA